MQRARRFICSTVSHSSHSNTTLRARKRSRTSSADGDSLLVNRETGNFEDATRRRSNNRGAKGSFSGKARPSQKAAKISKIIRPSFGSLQNAVVLAPFHTLKRCFQTKLLDLYSLEKMKKINHKTKMAKKQNMSFEYDVIELKSPEVVVKKESKVTRKPKMKSRSASYCQCNKTISKGNKKKSQNLIQKKRMAESETLALRNAFRELASKRRKLRPTPLSLNSELSPRFDLCQTNDQVPFSDAVPSVSAASSRSKCDSWETYSNSASYKEEHLEGSLAISTTSFDSYLEHFDKSSMGYSDSSWRGDRQIRSRVTPERLAADFLPKPDADSIRHSGKCVERKISEGQIVDFMDREPQTQNITESNQHLLPLRRQSKTKAKKSETDSGAGYYLRSHSFSKEKIPSERKSFTSSQPKTLQMEVATQVEGNNLELASAIRFRSIPKEPVPTSEVAPEKPPCDENSPPSDQKLESLQVEKSSCEIPLSRIVTPQKDVDSPPSDMNPMGEHSDGGSLESGLNDRIQTPTGSQQPQDKESDFIFGHRNTQSRLGETCQLSFGLKWNED